LINQELVTTTSDVMDVQCDELRDSLMTMDIDGADIALSHALRDYVRDIFEAEFMATFQGPSGTGLFIDRPGTEGRYCFCAEP
jgi:hypothetical protein